MTEEKTPDFITLKDLNPANIKFAPTKKGISQKWIPIIYNKKELMLKLSNLELTFDTKLFYGKLEVCLSIPKAKTVQQFDELEKVIIDLAFSNGWVNDSWTYLPIVKGSDNQKYSKYIKAKVPFDVKENSFYTTFYDKEGNEIEINNNDDICNLLPKSTSIKTVVTVSGLWFMADKKQWGVALKISQVRIITPVPVHISEPEDNCPFGSESEDLSEDEAYLFDDE